MKHLLFICCLGFQFLFAQQEIARLELESRDPKPDFYEYSPVDKGLVTLGPMSTVSTREVGITKYDAFLKKEWSKKVYEQNGRRHLDMLSVVGDNIMVFVSEYFPKEKVIKTFYYRYALNGDVEADEEILSVYPNQQEQKVDLGYTLSANKRLMLCFKDLSRRREADQILYYLFDDTGELAQNGEMNFKYKDDNFSVSDVKISNDGNIFVLGKFYQDGKRFDNTNYKFLFYRYDIKTQKMQEVLIDFGVKYVSDLSFRLDKDENVYLAGFYSNKGSDKIIGTVYQKISPEGKTLIETIDEFSDEFKSNFLSNGQIQRGKELANFEMHHDVNDNGIVLRSDGGVLLMAERNYVTSQSYRDMYGYWNQTNLYHYEEVILTSIDPNGKIEWHSIVDKSQAGQDPNRLSYMYAIGGKGVYVLYDYDARKLGTNIFYNIIDMEGKSTQRIPLIKEYKWSNEFYPKFSSQVSNSEMIVVYYTRGGKGLDILKLKVE